MSSRPQLGPAPVITNGSMATSLTSIPTICLKTSMLSYSVKWSAGSTPVGSISIEVSDDYALNAAGGVSNAGTWNPMPLSDTTDVSGDTGNGFIDILGTAGYAIRLVYTRTSGSGTLNVIVMSKVS